MKNGATVKVFREMAMFLELADENRFRIRAYENAAHTIEELTDDVEQLLGQGTLTSLAGIGKGMAEKVQEFCRTGKVAEHEQWKRKYPPALLDVMRLPGMGAKRTRFLYDSLRVDSVPALRKLAEEGRLREIKGFGAKIEANLLKALSGQGAGNPPTLLWKALRLASDIEGAMRRRCRAIEAWVPCGSLRRRKETVNDLDFLCVAQSPGEVMDVFTGLAGCARVLAKGDTKSSIVLADGMQCDLRVVPAQSLGAALLYFTGSKEHNVALRELALSKGMTVNEYGLYALSNKRKPLAARTEEEVYDKLGLQFIPPELRENRGEIALAQSGRIPRLVEEEDVRGDFHNHTHLSDGHDGLEEMARAARAKGWEWFASADHSQSLKIARGLSPGALLKKKAEVARLNAGFKGFKLLLSSEVDILGDGTMDYDDATLSQIDFVIASIHSGFKQEEEQLTRRVVRAIENPRVDVIGHLTGRLIGKRDPYPIDVQEVLESARRAGAAIEINGQPERLDLHDAHARAAADLGVALALDTDAHSARELDFMTLAVYTARRAGLGKHQILNCKSYAEILAWKQERLKRRTAAAR